MKCLVHTQEQVYLSIVALKSLWKLVDTCCGIIFQLHLLCLGLNVLLPSQTYTQSRFPSLILLNLFRVLLMNVPITLKEFAAECYDVLGSRVGIKKQAVAMNKTISDCPHVLDSLPSCWRFWSTHRGDLPWSQSNPA